MLEVCQNHLLYNIYVDTLQQIQDYVKRNKHGKTPTHLIPFFDYKINIQNRYSKRYIAIMYR